MDDVYYPKNAWELTRLLFTLPFDIAHLHIGGTLPARLLGLSALCCSLPGKKAVLTFHSGGYPSSPEGRTAGPWTLRGFVFRRFDRIIGVNPEIVQLFRKFGVPEKRIRLIEPHSVSHAAASDGLSAHLENFFQSHCPVLLTVSLLEPEYDLPTQIEALGLVRDQFPEAGLVIVGAGGLEQETRALIAAQPYRDHILLCGDVPHAETLTAIHRADVFLRTTLYDGDSVSVREALHLGTPVIATDNGMRPAGVTLVPLSSPAAVRDAVAARLLAGSSRPQAAEDNANIQAVFDLYRELVP